MCKAASATRVLYRLSQRSLISRPRGMKPPQVIDRHEERSSSGKVDEIKTTVSISIEWIVSGLINSFLKEQLKLCLDVHQVLK